MLRKEVRKVIEELSREETRGFLRELTKSRQSLIDERNALKNRTRPKEKLSVAKIKKLNGILGDLAPQLEELNSVPLETKKEMFAKVEANQDLDENEKSAYRSFIFTTENEIPESATFLFQDASKNFDSAIKEMTVSIEECLKKFPIWNDFMKNVRGVGPAHAGELIAYLDIHKANYVSSFWKYCGMAVDTETGKSDRRIKGKKIEYNPKLKRRCYLIADNLLKQNDEYRKIYNDRKHRTTNSSREWTKSHIHNDAMRYMVKMFVKDLWVAWRGIEGLEITPTYQEAKLGYTGKHSTQV